MPLYKEGRSPEQFCQWTNSAKIILLDRLPYEVIVTWLKQAHNCQLAELAEDNAFVSKLDEITQGYPLYLRHLINELNHATAQGENIRLILEETPKGFEQYVRVQRDNLDRLGLADELWQFFALLAVAKGTLEKADIKVLTGLKDRSLRELNQCWHVTRWLKSSEDESYTFAHPCLAEAFAAQLEEDTGDALRNLINYCSQWKNHSSRYALLYYAEHLKQDQQWDNLFALARNSEFVKVQREVFVDQPTLLLRATQTALKSAVEIDNPSAIAEFLLRHAYQLAAESKAESPLQVLRSGNLTRALELIELYQYQSAEMYILWSLLVAWELKDTEQQQDARGVLGKLHDRFRATELRAISSKDLLQGHLAAEILAYIFEVDTEGCTGLSQRLLGDPGFVCWSTLESTLCQRGLFSEAIELQKRNVYSLAKIAELQAQKISPEVASTTYWKIIDSLTSLEKQSYCVFWVADSAETLLKIGFNQLAKQVFARLTEIADGIQDFDDKIETLLHITNSLLEVSKVDCSFQEQASATLDKIDIDKVSDLRTKAKILMKTAKLMARSGELSSAKTLFSEALEIAQRIVEPKDRQKVLEHIIFFQLSVNFTSDAIETVKQMADDTRRSVAVSDILGQQLEEKDFEAAFKTVNRFYQDWDEASGLQRIAQAQAEARQFSEAIKTARLISDDFHKGSAWTSIVKVQAQTLFESEDNLVTLEEILETIEQEIPTRHEQAQALMEVASVLLAHKNFEAAIQAHTKLQLPDDRASADKQLAIAYAQNGDFNQAFAIAQRICVLRSQRETFQAIAQIQLREGRSNEARSTYVEVLNLSTKFDIPGSKIVALLNIANVQIKTGQEQAATTTLQWASKDIELINDLYREPQFLAFLAEKWMKLGEAELSRQKFEKSIELAEEFQKRQIGILHTSAVFIVIAAYQALAGNFDAALKIAEQINSWSNKAEFYKIAANAWSENRNPVLQGKLKKIFNDAFEEFQQSPGFPFENRIAVFCDLAVAQYKVGDELAASEIFAQLHQQVKENKNDQNQSGELARIVSAYTQISDLNSAIAVFNDIEAPQWRIQALWVIAHAQFEQQQTQATYSSLQLAIQAYEEIQDESQRAKAIGIIAKIQALAGEYYQALRIAETVSEQHAELLAALADYFVDIGEVEYFKQLILPSSYYLESAYRMCQALSQLYPEQSRVIAEVVQQTQ